MADLNHLLGRLLGSPAASGFAGGVAGGVASNLLTSKRGRKMGKKALKYGGLVALGGLAYHAWQRHQQQQAGAAATPQGAAASPPPPPPPLPAAGARGALPEPQQVVDAGFLPPEGDEAAQESTGLLLVRAMIAAARADGRLDGAETQAILDRSDELDLPADEKAQLFDEMRNPVGIDQLAAGATTPQLAAEVYLAALMAIETDTPDERRWLDELAGALKLDPGLVKELEAVDAESA